MKSALVVLLFVASAFGQTPSGPSTSACGPKSDSFQAKVDKSPHTSAQADPEKALIYFLQEKGSDAFAVTTRIGIDGAWVGANKNSSYFAASVVPGEHHVCASVQSYRGHPVGLVHFTAEAGKIYYFDGRVVYGATSDLYFFLGAVDSDQGKYLIGSLPLSVSTPSTPKKESSLQH
ncbi:MAG: hypothetical protein WAM13_09080 [Candidatus Sulfotelmatobacter sp.]